MLTIALGLLFGAAGAHALLRPDSMFWRSRYSEPHVKRLGMFGVGLGIVLVAAGVARGYRAYLPE